MQPYAVAAHREVFQTRTGVQVFGARGYNIVEGPSIAVDIACRIPLISALEADVPVADTPDGFDNHGVIGAEEILLLERGSVHEVNVEKEVLPLEMVSKSDVIDEAAVHVLHHVESPDGVPYRSDLAHPGQVVGINSLKTVGKGRGANLERQQLVLRQLAGSARSEGETLVDAVAELAVEININGDSVVLIAAYQDGVLANAETPSVGGLPVDVEEICGVEDVVLVENLLVETLPQLMWPKMFRLRWSAMNWLFTSPWSF